MKAIYYIYPNNFKDNKNEYNAIDYILGQFDYTNSYIYSLNGKCEYNEFKDENNKLIVKIQIEGSFNEAELNFIKQDLTISKGFDKLRIILEENK